MKAKTPMIIKGLSVWLFIYGAFLGAFSPAIGFVFWVLSYFVYSQKKRAIQATIVLPVLMGLVWTAYNPALLFLSWGLAAAGVIPSAFVYYKNKKGFQ